MKAGRPRKQRPWRPGAPAPIQAAGCGPGRHLAIPAPKRTSNPLKLTAHGWMPDLLGTWHHRKKKGSSATVINDRQYLAGREVERLIEEIAGRKGNLKSFDNSLPVVDQSFRHRLGCNQNVLDAVKLVMRLRAHLGHHDFLFVMNVLFGMGLHGAMLHEAGLPRWDPTDRYLTTGGAAGILGPSGAYKIIPEFADPSSGMGKAGSFEVDNYDRDTSIYWKHLVPNENGFTVDRGAELAERDKAAGRRVIKDNKDDIKREKLRDKVAEIKLEAQRDGVRDIERDARLDDLESTGDLLEMFDIASRALHSRRQPDADIDPDTAAMMEMHRKDPPIDMRGHGEDKPPCSIAEVIDTEDLVRASKSTRDRAIDAFGIRGVELGSVRFRALLTKIADLLERDESVDEPAATTAPLAQIPQRSDIPFEVEIIREYATVNR